MDPNDHTPHPAPDVDPTLRVEDVLMEPTQAPLLDTDTTTTTITIVENENQDADAAAVEDSREEEHTTNLEPPQPAVSPPPPLSTPGEETEVPLEANTLGDQHADEMDLLQQLMAAPYEEVDTAEMFELPDELDADTLDEVARRSIDARHSVGFLAQHRNKKSSKRGGDMDVQSSVGTMGSDAPQMYMHELFGRFFHATTAETQEDAAPRNVDELLGEEEDYVDPQRPVDPSLLDTRGVLRTLYGTDVRETNVELNKVAAFARLADILESKKRDQETEELGKLFGPHASWNAPSLYQGFGILKAAPSSIAQPIVNHIEDPNSTVFLAEMPKVGPNRQILHVDATPFDPRQSDPEMIPVNTDRRVYTPSNVLRWCIDPKQNVALSNARLMRWSNGTYTLHVGSELYELRGSSDNVVTMLAAPTEVKKRSVALPALAGAVQYDEVLHIRQARADSITDILVSEGTVNRSIPVERRLGLHTGRTLPVVDMKKPRNEQDEIEQFIATERENRRKEIVRRAREGNPMSLGEQLQREQSMMQTVQESKTADELRRAQESQQQLLRLEGSRRSGGGSHRFAREQEEEGEYQDDEAMARADDVLREMLARGTEPESEVRFGKRSRDADGEEEMLRDTHRPPPQATAATASSCIASLRNLAQSLPSDSLSFGAVEATIALLEGRLDHWDNLQGDVRLLLDEVHEEFPHADTTEVERLLSPYV